MSNNINLQQAVRNFMQIGGQSVDRFDAKQITLYTGLQLEELSEKLLAIKQGCINRADKDKFDYAIDVMCQLADELKAGLHMGDVVRGDRAGMLDADIDLAWVAIGGALSISTSAEAAAAEVIRANLDKFPGGVAIRDDNGKIQKPANWQAPQLSHLVEPAPN